MLCHGHLRYSPATLCQAGLCGPSTRGQDLHPPGAVGLAPAGRGGEYSRPGLLGLIPGEVLENWGL